MQPAHRHFLMLSTFAAFIWTTYVVAVVLLPIPIATQHQLNNLASEGRKFFRPEYDLNLYSAFLVMTIGSRFLFIGKRGISTPDSFVAESPSAKRPIVGNLGAKSWRTIGLLLAPALLAILLLPCMPQSMVSVAWGADRFRHIHFYALSPYSHLAGGHALATEDTCFTDSRGRWCFGWQAAMPTKPSSRSSRRFWPLMRSPHGGSSERSPGAVRGFCRCSGDVGRQECIDFRCPNLVSSEFHIHAIPVGVRPPTSLREANAIGSARGDALWRQPGSILGYRHGRRSLSLCGGANSDGGKHFGVLRRQNSLSVWNARWIHGAGCSNSPRGVRDGSVLSLRNEPIARSVACIYGRDQRLAVEGSVHTAACVSRGLLDHSLSGFFRGGTSLAFLSLTGFFSMSMFINRSHENGLVNALGAPLIVFAVLAPPTASLFPPLSSNPSAWLAIRRCVARSRSSGLWCRPDRPDWSDTRCTADGSENAVSSSCGARARLCRIRSRRPAVRRGDSEAGAGRMSAISHRDRHDAHFNPVGPAARYAIYPDDSIGDSTERGMPHEDS